MHATANPFLRQPSRARSTERLAFGLFRFAILAFAEKHEPGPVPVLSDDLPHEETHQ